MERKMQIYVASNTGRGVFALQVSPVDRVDHVKELICERHGIPIHLQQRIVDWSTGKLLRDGWSLAQCNVTNQSMLHMTVALKGGMQIQIKTLTGRQQAFNFEPETKVIEVKAALQEKEGIQVDQIRLIYSGKQLQDDMPLSHYNVAAGAVIHMVLQLRGG